LWICDCPKNSGMSTSTSTLATFFKGSDTQFGIFYPTDYLVAIFPDVAIARRAEHALGLGGFLDEDVIAAPGEEIVRFAEEHLQNSSLWGMLMRQLSRIFATEEVYADYDLILARQGAAFLAAYCPTEKRKDEAWEIIEHFDPIKARHYELGCVEHLRGEL
jgi:hypothetical protein